jgi:hypothetical protein
MAITSTSLSTLLMIIDLTEELVTSTPNKKESRENQAKMSGGMLKLQCKLGGRMTTRQYVMQTRESKQAVPVSANYKQSCKIRK